MVSGPVTLLTLLATLAVFVAVGVRAHRRGAGVEDYLVARNSQDPLTLGLSLLAAGMGAWVLFAPPEVGATVGPVAVAGYALGAAAPLVAFGALGPRIRDVLPSGLSLPEFVRLRFGRGFHAYVGAISILYMLFFVTAELTAVGGVTAILSQADPRVAIVAVAVATLAYTTYGGLRASLRTDRFQAWLILGLLALAVVTVAAFNTAGPVTTAPPAGPRPAGLPVAVTLVIAVTAANLLHQGYWQRVWAARDDRALRRGVALGVATTIPVVAVLGGLGILAGERGVELGSPPVPFFALLATAPPWLGLAVLVLGLALVASSVDTLETGLASLVTAERPGMTLLGARVATVVLLIPAVAVALQGYSVLRLFLIADLLCAATVVPALASLWPRATTQGALAGAVAGLLGAVVPGWLAGGDLGAALAAATFPGAVPTLPPFAGALALSAVTTAGVSLAGREVTDLHALGARVATVRGGAR